MTSQPVAEAAADQFRESAQWVVDYLNAHTPLGDWSVSRVAGGKQVHLHVHAQDLLHPGYPVPWEQEASFCYRMVNGADPVVADLAAHPQYDDLELAGVVRAYAGVPIANDDGSLFGVLCGFSPRPLDTAEAVDSELLELLSSLLSAQLWSARQLEHSTKELELAESLSQIDPMTGLLNRQGWEVVSSEAQHRIDAYADPVALAVVDLDALKQVNDLHGHLAGDELLARTADALRSVAGDDDRVARYGGDEFVILSYDVADADAEAYFERFRHALTQAGCPASFGVATAVPVHLPIAGAFAEADRRMYEDKALRRTALEAEAG